MNAVLQDVQSVPEFNRLLKGMQSGKPSPASKFIKQYEPVIRRAIRRHKHLSMVRSVGVEDLVQETLMHLLNAPECETHVGGYLRAIAHGRVNKQIEKDYAQRRMPRPQDGSTGRCVSLEEVGERCSRAPSAEQLVLFREAENKLLATLPRSDRQILRLMSAGYRQVEIARVLRVCDRTIRRRVKGIRAAVAAAMSN